MPLITQISTRKRQRKEARNKRKHHKGQQRHEDDDVLTGHDTVEEITEPSHPSKVPRTASSSTDKSSQKEAKKTKKNTGGLNGKMDPALAEAIKRDDDEIAELEKKLGLASGGRKKKTSKDKQNKEYAKLEGYGDDFGDFLDDLDEMVLRVTNTKRRDQHDDNKAENADIISTTKRGKSKTHIGKLGDGKHSDPYASLDPNMAELLRRDDDEIIDLETKLGISKRKGKDKLYKEYSKLEGYGDDFGVFLDDLDDMMIRLSKPTKENPAGRNQRSHEEEDDEDEEEDEDEDEDKTEEDSINGGDRSESEDEDEDEAGESDAEELVPMKGPYEELDEDDSVLDELERMETEKNQHRNLESSDESESDSEGASEEEIEQEVDNDEQDDRSTGSDSDDSSNDSRKSEPDHDIKDTYRPTTGEDIYGNTLATENSGGIKPSKYVPPHMRKKQLDDDDSDQERRRAILRSLNNALNRLSEDTLVSVAQQVAAQYAENPTQMVHEMIWKNAKDACVSSSMLMTGLIPVYVACIAGVHIQTGDIVQVGESILENIVVDLWEKLASFRKRIDDMPEGNETSQDDGESKQICNMMLMLGYLYNYNIVHCSLMYDVIRQLIENFSDVDVECLLILLSHCGRSLRSDDPSALKEIVLLVQKKKIENSTKASSSRSDYMISAIMDLKNNRRKQQDNAHAETVMKFRKSLGRIKTASAKSGVSKSSSEASLRISLNDILNAEQKGRWWKVGASWVGNQYRFSDETADESKSGDLVQGSEENKSGIDHEEQNEELIQLASKLRMNTDRKRAVFCIIMGGTDCEDTFEKLCRSSLLQNRSERDTVRVLMECCGSERSYNKFYGHLAARICEYQPQSKFSLQLAFWDAFKQFGTMGARKAANLAKFLFHLVVTYRSLKLLPIIKTIDVSGDDTDETAMIFLTIVLSSVLDHFDDPQQAKALFARHVSSSPNANKHDEEDEGIRAGLFVFFMETLKSSPKNQKGSRFRKNFKAIIKELDTDGFESMF